MGWVKNCLPSKGDLLRVKRKKGYYHFGIASDSNHAIHYSGPHDDSIYDPSKLKIIHTVLAEFDRGDGFEVWVPYSSKFSRDEVVERAMTYLNSPTFRGRPYNFLKNNCEHFARWAYEDQARCIQVRDEIMKIIDERKNDIIDKADDIIIKIKNKVN